MVKLTRLFQSNRTQAVRLPRDVAFPDSVTDVRILKDGNRRIIVPADSTWDDFFAEDPAGDFPERAEQPRPQDRESF
jgi:antitoxin VapB